MSEDVTKTPDEMTKEELQAEIDKQQPEGEVEAPIVPPAEPPTEPAKTDEVTYTAVDGTVYKAATKEELYTIVTKALDNTKVAYREAKKTVEELKPKPAAKEPDAFDPAKYHEMILSDPLGAKRYIESFDEDSRSVRQFMTGLQEKETREAAVKAFYAEIPDYAKIETKELNDAFRARMAEAGRAVTLDNLKATYLDLMLAGKIPSVPNGEDPKKPKAPPPTPQGSGRSRPQVNEIELLERMKTTAEVREYIEKKARETAETLQ